MSTTSITIAGRLGDASTSSTLQQIERFCAGRRARFTARTHGRRRDQHHHRASRHSTFGGTRRGDAWATLASSKAKAARSADRFRKPLAARISACPTTGRRGTIRNVATGNWINESIDNLGLRAAAVVAAFGQCRCHPASGTFSGDRILQNPICCALPFYPLTAAPASGKPPACRLNAVQYCRGSPPRRTMPCRACRSLSIG